MNYNEGDIVTFFHPKSYNASIARIHTVYSDGSFVLASIKYGLINVVYKDLYGKATSEQARKFIVLWLRSELNPEILRTHAI